MRKIRRQSSGLGLSRLGIEEDATCSKAVRMVENLGERQKGRCRREADPMEHFTENLRDSQVGGG